MKQFTSKTSYTTLSRLGHWNNVPSSSMQAVASQSLLSSKQQYEQSSLKKQSRGGSPYQWPSRNTRTCFLRKPPPNYHPLNHTTMPSNSRTCSYPNEPRLTCSIPSNIKPAKSSLKNISRQGKSPLQNLPKLHHSSLSKRRKLGNYVPAKIIGASIAILSRMPTPFPLSPTLLTNYEDHQLLPNSTYDRNTITFSSNQRTNESPPSPPH